MTAASFASYVPLGQVVVRPHTPIETHSVDLRSRHQKFPAHCTPNVFGRLVDDCIRRSLCRRAKNCWPTRYSIPMQFSCRVAVV